jgi:hypothetical protein
MEKIWKRALDLLVKNLDRSAMRLDGQAALCAAELFRKMIESAGLVAEPYEISDYLMRKHKLPESLAGSVEDTYYLVDSLIAGVPDVDWASDVADQLA